MKEINAIATMMLNGVAGEKSVYKQAVPYCNKLCLATTHTQYHHRNPLFLKFEHLFDYKKFILKKPEFQLRRYTKKHSDSSLYSNHKKLKLSMP